MDNGEVIPGLNEDWTFAGASLFEWLSGFVAMILASSAFAKPAQYAPLLIGIMITTTLALAANRRRYPDEVRGLRNALMSTLGFDPPDIPTPASLQPYWSGAPLRVLPESTEFRQLGLDKVFRREEPKDPV
jgi:hypothetical protein